MSETLYDKYDGDTAIGDIVHSFYEKVMNTDSLVRYFQGIDMRRLMRHQTDFLSMIFGGPVAYSGLSLREAHRRLSITTVDFQTFAGLLGETLGEAGVEDDDVEIVMGTIFSTHDDIVSARR